MGTRAKPSRRDAPRPEASAANAITVNKTAIEYFMLAKGAIRKPTAVWWWAGGNGGAGRGVSDVVPRLSDSVRGAHGSH